MNGGPIGPRRPTHVTGDATFPFTPGMPVEELHQLLHEAIEKAIDDLQGAAELQHEHGYVVDVATMAYKVHVEATCQVEPA